MPNWCANRLTVYGDPAELQRFLAAQAGRGAAYNHRSDGDDRLFTFNAQVPVPAEVLSAGYGSGSSQQQRRQLLHPGEVPLEPVSGFVWQVNHWGTARDLDPGGLRSQLTGDRLDLEFSTVWSPPAAWVTAVAALWPTLQFDLAYIEPGGGFAGRLTVRGQHVLTDDTHDITGADFEAWGYEPDEDEPDAEGRSSVRD